MAGVENLGVRLSARPRVAVVGGGWAGLAAAVTLADWAEVTVFEAGLVLGGRARRLARAPDGVFDNGQHLLLGAYSECLRLMRRVGAAPEALLWRTPQRLDMAGEHSFAMPPWPAPLNQLAGWLGWRGAPWGERWRWLRALLALRAQGFAAPPEQTVADWLRQQGQSAWLTRTFWEPLTLAALNTPIERAAMACLAAVLRDGVAGPAAHSDMLMPRVDLSALFPEPAAHWLTAQGHAIRVGYRVKSLFPVQDGVEVDGEHFAAAVLATAPQHVTALLDRKREDAADWLAPINKLDYQPIYTVYLRAHRPEALPQPWLGLVDAPWGQWVFDRQRCTGHAGWLALVISGPGPHQAWSAAELLSRAAAGLNQRFAGLGAQAEGQVIAERRATFSCDAGLTRAAAQGPWPRLALAGDHVAGPYPATLEGAVRSGAHAAYLLKKVLNC